jgi:hypothetical protein
LRKDKSIPLDPVALIDSSYFNKNNCWNRRKRKQKKLY